MRLLFAFVIALYLTVFYHAAKRLATMFLIEYVNDIITIIVNIINNDEVILLW